MVVRLTTMEAGADRQGEGAGGRVVAGRYRLVERLGAGAHSSVYLATRDEAPHEVAVKLLNPFVTDPKLATERMFREARMIARLDHPGCVRLVDWGADGDTPFVVLELVRGESLRLTLIREGKLRPERAADIAVQVCKALEAAHALKIVHRDLKPENIMLLDAAEGAPERVKVLDFGIARLLPADEPEETLPRELTVPGSVLGTPCYMAPEQLRNPEVDGRADIYACGVLLYEMIAGQVPIDAGNPVATILALATRPPRPIRELLPDVDEDLEQLIMRCLEKDPSARWQEVREVGAVLRAWLLGRRGQAGVGAGTIPIADMAQTRPAVSPSLDAHTGDDDTTEDLEMPTAKLSPAVRDVVNAYRQAQGDEVEDLLTVPRLRVDRAGLSEGDFEPDSGEANTAAMPKRRRVATIRMSNEEVYAANEADRRSSAGMEEAGGPVAGSGEEVAPDSLTVRLPSQLNLPARPRARLDSDFLLVSPYRSMLGVGALVLATLVAVLLAWWIWR